MASMKKKDAVWLVVDILEQHIGQATEEEVRNLAEEIVDRLENVEIYDASDTHFQEETREWPQEEDE